MQTYWFLFHFLFKLECAFVRVSCAWRWKWNELLGTKGLSENLFLYWVVMANKSMCLARRKSCCLSACIITCSLHPSLLATLSVYLPFNVNTREQTDLAVTFLDLSSGGSRFESQSGHRYPEGGVLWFSSVSLSRCLYNTSIMPWQLRSKSFSICHHSVIIPLDPIYIYI